MKSTPSSLKRSKIREILGRRRNRGSKSAIARELGITPQSVSTWLGGRVKSARIARAANQKALALLAAEAQAPVAEGVV